jgi:hypothetical protein
VTQPMLNIANCLGEVLERESDFSSSSGSRNPNPGHHPRSRMPRFCEIPDSRIRPQMQMYLRICTMTAWQPCLPKSPKSPHISNQWHGVTFHPVSQTFRFFGDCGSGGLCLQNTRQKLRCVMMQCAYVLQMGRILLIHVASRNHARRISRKGVPDTSNY